MNILISLPWAPTLTITPGRAGPHDVVVERRGSDWRKSGARKLAHFAGESYKVLRRARRFDAVVLATVGMEAFFAGAGRGLLCPRTRVVCADFLAPRGGRLVNWAQPGLRRVDAFACIRTGDVETLGRRFGVNPAKCHFVPFPVNDDVLGVDAPDGDYVYSGGFAHRDWPTLVRALLDLPYRAVLSTSAALDIPAADRDRIRVLPMQKPEEGRRLMAGAGVVALSFHETHLPSGPLVLLDALGMGKATVATNVNGTRDYVRDGETALLVPPGNAAALAAAIRVLMEDGARRRAMAAAAKQDVRTRFTTQRFLDGVIGLCEAGRPPGS